MFSSFYKPIPGETSLRTGVYENSSASFPKLPSFSKLSRSSPSSFSLSSVSSKSVSSKSPSSKRLSSPSSSSNRPSSPRSPSSRSSSSSDSLPDISARVEKYFSKHKKNIFEVGRLAVRLTREYYPNVKNKRKKQEEMFEEIVEELEDVVSEGEQELLREALSCNNRELQVILDYVDHSVVEKSSSRVFAFLK
ncbi:hypothetical protein GAYE_SCF13G3443 [Galdieria yellowstonensis]|uniref:Uncharacterized protein n=1 Tax=Galdieria yellowstonensis TaxID=3028027 RepID=A0AAV9IDL7_9RHOD|nr:hypothetical protein GAYE_SCF13G3443 [Galdieria yellowstonensis]